MTEVQIKNTLKKAVKTGKECTFTKEDAKTLLAGMEENKANKALVQSIVDLMMVECMDDDALVDAIQDALCKATMMTAEKAAPAPKKAPAVKKVAPATESN